MTVLSLCYTFQGVVMGVVVSLTAIGRIISPLWCKLIALTFNSCCCYSFVLLVSFSVDASYEAVGKRTFLAMTIMLLTHIPCLVLFLALYTKLKSKPLPSPKKALQDQACTSSGDELSE